MKDNTKVRVRYAPSPTGNLHIGGARTALFNYLFAKHNKGTFIIRTEDTDTKRNIEGGEKSQIENLEWLGIIADESPLKPNAKYGKYRQSERRDTYDKYVKILLEKKLAYKCYCTSEELEKEKEEQVKKGLHTYRYSKKCSNLEDQDKPYSIRLKLPDNKDYKWNDIVRGDVSFNSNDIGDFVIVKTNGMPTYNFAVVIDDILMEITHVLRGEEHVSNTPKQLAIFEMLEQEPPLFGHMTLITNHDGKKLSKRDETIMQFVEQYKDSGYLPEAMLNFLTLLGWSPEGEKEIFTKEEIIKIFDIKRLSKSPSTFDKPKLIWVNNRYIKDLSEEDYLKMIIPFIENEYGKNKTNNEVALLYKQQISYSKEIIELSELFFKDKYTVDKEAKEFLKENKSDDVKKEFLNEMEKSKKLDIETIATMIKSVGATTEKKGKLLFMPIRIFVSGQTHGPDLKQTILLLGKDKIIKNLKG